ncbi:MULTISPECIES: tRNA pseudouridine(55) synthase TruB [Brucella/Ochrobactrum group]|jgi:tRNA pseudouridine55 synthase|uniref:tRNA pseudouridine synthase B n=1 Tax=Brucella pseudintermedia TaxID=370111 RepID=A0ABY5U8N1_9HYPH|nr:MULTISPECIES: tRNA pseudouridine(55) synthase TruB [Brucella/Ochrobactrum group]KAB2682574.1 tRNA pseudouridine(55) synthase TruB [Brucella pseudintermedia]MCO7725034.1 tRNA pseudouridine(55) synthase TruB [Brucella intermedia]NKE76185.1 tRNA pseudouridine(55) synthase TruB [Ochrobactrum sp. MC-1LL]TWH00239.1 tRNA pseudouridine synthase B [Ochrobactrum sp. J50]UWL59698.1 tRNA pseudouridine(55) synthase TruB [Brucella pseudintermedia]
MARRGKKKGRPISGWVIFDKPKGMGSTEAVSKIKWLFNAEKAGHAGTLDPLASGMLPIALGEATKTVPYVMDGTKIYRFTVTWGEERSTDDLEGQPTKTSDKRPTRAEIEALLPNYTGVISQVPPQFSAIKIDGERAYDLAREGETVEIPSREVEIDRLEIVGVPDADRTEFEVECSKGTYVRSLARDMGRDLGCYGHISELRRIEVAPFTEEDSVTLAELEQAWPPLPPKDEDGNVIEPAPRRDFSAIDALVIDTGAALDCLPQVPLTDDQAQRVRLGNPVILRGRDAPLEADEACVTTRGKLLAIGYIEHGQFKPKRVFTTG